MEGDVLATAQWRVCSTPPGAVAGPAELSRLAPPWWPAPVPGTAAGALHVAGEDDADRRDYDATDWWFVCSFESQGRDGPWLLRLDGLATLADVWLNGRHLLHSENMFRSYEVDVDGLAHENELVIRFASLNAALGPRRPRPRWRTSLLAHQNLRWFRTTLLGRVVGFAATPAPVGPWRGVTLAPRPRRRIVARRIEARCEGGDGVVELSLDVRGTGGLVPAVLHVGASHGPLDVDERGDVTTIRGSLRVADARRWWPHTHGDPTLYRLRVELGDEVLDLGSVGFRTVEVDRAGGAFELIVNDVPIFCRGAVWMPVDPVSLIPTAPAVRDTLELARAANLNMVRLPGTGVYQDATFWDLCDELGLLVWQDCMLAFADPPDTPEFLGELETELVEVFAPLGGRPSLGVICGGQEIEEQASMLSVAVRAGVSRPSTRSFPQWRRPAAGSALRHVESNRRLRAEPDGHRREPILRCRRVPPARR